jgi:hypothetical protein
LIKSAAIGGLAIIIALALLSGNQRGLDGHAVASWSTSDEPSAAAPPVHSLEGEQQLALAFTAAFGGSDEVIRSVGTMHEPTRFRAGVLVATSFGPVLLSEGQVLAPRAASTGKLAAFYLARTSDGFRPLARFLPAIESGSMGRLTDWSVRTDLGRYPVVEVHGAGSSRGSACSWTTLLELTPEGPAELVTIPTAFDDSEALLDGRPTRVEGRIRPVAAGRSISVAYSGSAAFTERFVRHGSRYVLAGGGRSRMKSC